MRQDVYFWARNFCPDIVSLIDSLDSNEQYLSLKKDNDTGVYTQGVTALDHLASIVMHCKTGMEETIINEANVITIGEFSLLPEEQKNRCTHRKCDDEAIAEVWRFVGMDHPKERNQFLKKFNEKAYRKIMKKVVPQFQIKEIRCDNLLRDARNTNLLQFIS